MADAGYVWEKVMLSVQTMVEGSGTFDERMADAYLSQLHRLTPGDPPAEIADELYDVLRLAESHITGGHTVQPFNEEERRRIASHLVHILIETTEMKGNK